MRIAALALLLLSAAADEFLYVRSAGVVLRAEPSLGARVVGTIAPRSKVQFLGARSDVEEIEGETGRWAKVRSGDKAGWVFDRNLSFAQPLTSEEATRRLLRRGVRCEHALLKLKPGGGGTAVAEPHTSPPAPTLRNVRWWGDGPFYVVFEVWGLSQEGLSLCELDFNDARDDFDAREVDLRRRAPDTMSPLGIDTECRGKAVAQDEGCTPLVAAVAQGRADEVATLLKRGVDVNGATRWGWTALHHAAWSGRAAVVEALLNGGANKNAKGHDGCSPLHLAAGAGHGPVVAALLERKVDLEDTDRNGRTALHWAADKGNPGAIAALIERGLSPDLRDFHGWTALAYAARKGHLEALRGLLDRKADPNLRDRDDATALHVAAAECRAAIVDALVARGADPGLRDRYGLQPLHHAFFARCAQIPARLTKLESSSKKPP
jgi:ankyrin repeat protein